MHPVVRGAFPTTARIPCHFSSFFYFYSYPGVHQVNSKLNPMLGATIFPRSLLPYLPSIWTWLLPLASPVAPVGNAAAAARRGPRLAGAQSCLASQVVCQQLCTTLPSSPCSSPSLQACRVSPASVLTVSGWAAE